MKTKVQKWGNSLALRIPRSFANETHLEPNATVEMTLVDGNLIISPVYSAAARLEQLLEEVREDNLPQEWQTNAAVGREVW
jgi:antitoxin MazE